MSDAATTTLSSNGQVVIPEVIRDRLGLMTGAQFVVVADRDVVLDTNVFDSWTFFGGVPGRILAEWSTGAIHLVISPPILDEYRRVGLELSKGREPLVRALETLIAMLTARQFVEPLHRTR